LTGERRVLLRQHDTSAHDDLAHVQADLSSASHLTLEHGFGPTGAGERRLAVLDVASGVVTPDAYTIDPPWLCFTEYCFRD
jgi:hypothetical protein